MSKLLLQILSPFGEWGHSKGCQVVDEIAGIRMRKDFESIFRKIFRKSVPIYEGHPDDEFEIKNLKGYEIGEVEGITINEEGIVVLCRYESGALERMESLGFKYLSPRWQMESLGGGRYRPIKLISIGMTDNPNIKGSGKVVSGVVLNNDFLRSTENKLKDANKRLGEALEKCDAIAKLIRDSGRIKKEKELESAIKTFKSRPKGKELASLAKERMKETGESYIKSFSAVRKKFLKN